MTRRIVILALIATAWATALVAQQKLVGQAKTDPSPAKAARPAKAAPTPHPATAEVKVAKSIDPDQAYKANCSRCHLEPNKFSERKMGTIIRHMRVRANLTEEDAEAILHYLPK